MRPGRRVSIDEPISKYIPAFKDMKVGFGVRKDAGMVPTAGSVGEYNWGGAGGTYFWADPKENMFVVFGMQSPRHRVAYRQVLRNMIYAAIENPVPGPSN